MVMLTFCRLFPEWLGSAVSRLVLVDTTYTNPLRTTSKRKLATALQKSFIEPLLYLQIWLSPLVWVMNWCSYWNGSSHWSAARTSFAGTQTRSQLDFVASFQPRHSPAVLARGALGILRYDASKILSQIRIPTLILCGDQDAVTMPEASEHIDREVPAASLHKLAPGKHCAHIEHETEFARRLATFCTGVNSESPSGAIERSPLALGV
jgi:pimeloyl-ACP methyl ester carboxylesterase